MWGPPVEAATVDGSASVWTYFRDDSVDHAIVVPTLSLNFRRLAGDALRFETSLRGYSDFRNGESNDEQLRVLRGVLICAPKDSPWEARLGQQWLTEGVGRGNVAGPWVRRKFGQSSLTVYGGARLQSSLSLSEKNANNGYAAGLHARTKLGMVKLGASYFYLGKSGDVLFQGAGVEAEAKPVRNLLTRGRLDLNLSQSAIEIAQVLADWTPQKSVQVTGEFRIQTPRIFEDSYFTRFLEEASTTHLRGGARWNFWEDKYATVNGVTLFSVNPDPLYKVRFGLGMDDVEAGYTHWLTVSGGEMDGFYGRLHGDMEIDQRKLGEVFGGFDFARGSNADVNLRPKNESQSIYLGLSVNPVQALSVSATAEQLRDLDSKKEWRGIFSIGYRFAGARPEAHP